jgi:hypothetical protein
MLIIFVVSVFIMTTLYHYCDNDAEKRFLSHVDAFAARFALAVAIYISLRTGIIVEIIVQIRRVRRALLLYHDDEE